MHQNWDPVKLKQDFFTSLDAKSTVSTSVWKLVVNTPSLMMDDANKLGVHWLLRKLCIGKVYSELDTAILVEDTNFQKFYLCVRNTSEQNVVQLI